MIENLLEKDLAYIANGNVYFDVSKANDYYKLSGKNQEELMIGDAWIRFALAENTLLQGGAEMNRSLSLRYADRFKCRKYQLRNRQPRTGSELMSILVEICVGSHQTCRFGLEFIFCHSCMYRKIMASF
jgi:hypothetical protein